MSDDISNAIAIIGIACKFPKAENSEEYWNNIKEGRECMETLSQEELGLTGIGSDVLQNGNYIRRCPCVTDIDKFDADFFKISPREATYMDPQQRMLLEKAWEAVEDAGYRIDEIEGKVAIFASTSASSYFLQNIMNNPNFVEEAGGMKAVLHGLDKDHIATKIAYKLNLTGPAVTVQSACSSSMVGTIMACQNLLTYQCDVALAGGVTINVPQRTGYLYEKGNVMSQDGYCRPFDESASGTVFGSGAGCVVLKRLEDAMEDNDRIYSVIRGFAIGNDGNDKVGYTAPGISGQMDVIGDALEFAQIDPATISYVEAHGTATIMGDPIEVDAISRVYERYTNKKQYCALGSVKANIGHLNVASGIAGVIKTALLIRNRTLPPLINLKQESTKINFKSSPFYINRECKAYEGKEPMRAAVSSFGIGGTNGHIVMEEFSEEKKEKITKRCYLLPVSARDEEDLRQMCRNLARYMTDNAKTSLADAERTLQCGRKEFAVRKAFFVKNVQELVGDIDECLKEVQTGTEQERRTFQVIISDRGEGKSLEIEELYKDLPLFRSCYDELRGQINAMETEEAMNMLLWQAAAVKAWMELGVEVEAILCVSKDEGGRLAEKISQYLGFPLKKGKLEEAEEKGYRRVICTYSYHEFVTPVVEWWQRGNKIHWEKWLQAKKQNIISLPTYPFKLNSYWSYNVKPKKETHKVMFMQNKLHERPDLSTPYVTPEGELQERFIQMWGELLGIEGIGAEDDFFELGGHSLMAIQLIAAIKDEFLVELEIDELFDCSTISKLADMVADKLGDLIDGMDEQEIDAYLERKKEYGISK